MLKIKVFHKELVVERIVADNRRNKLILGIGVITALELMIDLNNKTFSFIGDKQHKTFDWVSKERTMTTANSFEVKDKEPTDENLSDVTLIKPPTNKELHEVDMPTEIKDIKDLIGHFPELFSEKLGKCQYLKVPIETGSTPPVKSAMRFYPQWKQVVIKEIIEKLMDKGIIQESRSPWRAWPLILIKPDGGGYRFCIDYRKLNDSTKEFAFPKPQ